MKKVLIITYYWPPAGGPGVQRWLKFVKYLPEFGIEPIVYCPENPKYPIMDTSMVSEVSSALEVIQAPINEPYKLAQLLSRSKTSDLSKGIITGQKKQTITEKLLLFVRGNFFIPDARVSWVKPSFSFLSDYIKIHKVDTIITTGPPHSLHLIGLKLKQSHSLKWITDFRDPWTHIGYHKKLKLTRLSKRKHKQLEASVLMNSDQIIVTSQQTKLILSKRTKSPVIVITNGYDFEINKSCKLDTKFTLSHVGNLQDGRNPEFLWKTLHDLVQNSIDFSKHFRLNLIGYISEAVLNSIRIYGLEAYTNYSGYVSHSEALEYQSRTQLLLLIEENSKETKYIIPGKLFEYIASRRPIIAIGPDGSDIENIVTKSASGNYFRYEESELLSSVILGYFERYKRNDLYVEPKEIEKYNRRNLTFELSKLL
ncbi:glycosyl transferase family 1 [Flavobacteriaceae bacterium]|nr:glycosyl transferase family 1 [Flavobacteriaceae bacterium]